MYKDNNCPKLLYQLRWKIMFFQQTKTSCFFFGKFLQLHPILAQSSEDLRSSNFQSASYLGFFRLKSGRYRYFPTPSMKGKHPGNLTNAKNHGFVIKRYLQLQKWLFFVVSTLRQSNIAMEYPHFYWRKYIFIHGGFSIATGCLGYIGDYTTQLCGDSSKTIIGIPIKQPGFNGK